MAITIPEGAGQAAFIFQLSGRATQYATTLGYQNTADDGPGAAALSIFQSWHTASGPFQPNTLLTGYTWVGVQCTEMVGGEPVIGQRFSPVIGTFGSPPLPPNCSFLVRKNTSRGGRKGRGRMFFPPCWNVGEDSISSTGQILPAFITSMQGQLDAALDAQKLTLHPPALLHSDGSAVNLIESLSLQALIATQRRRLR